MTMRAEQDKKRERRAFWHGAATAGLIAYLFCGLNVAFALKYAVPATNYIGVAYITAIWPLWVSQIWTGWTPPVPSAVFTFNG